MRAEIGPGMPKDQVSTPKEFSGQNAGLEMECNLDKRSEIYYMSLKTVIIKLISLNLCSKC